MGLDLFSRDSVARSLRELMAGVVMLVAVAAAVQLIAGFFPNPLTRALLGAVAVSVVAGRVGLQPETGLGVAKNRLWRGAVLGLFVVVVALGAALAMGSRVRVGEVGWMLWLGVADSLAVAYRDELWLRGIPMFFAVRAKVPVRFVLPYLAATGVVSVALESHTTLPGLVLIGAAGLAFGVLWLRTRTSWVPVAAHATWRLLADVFLAGDGFELDPNKLPTRAGASGALVWVSASAFLVAALVAWRWMQPESGRAREDEP